MNFYEGYCIFCGHFDWVINGVCEDCQNEWHIWL